MVGKFAWEERGGGMHCPHRVEWLDRDGRVLAQSVLDLGRIHLLAARDDHVLLALDDLEEAVRVERGQVARAQESVGGESRCGLACRGSKAT